MKNIVVTAVAVVMCMPTLSYADSCKAYGITAGARCDYSYTGGTPVAHVNYQEPTCRTTNGTTCYIYDCSGDCQCMDTTWFTNPDLSAGRQAACCRSEKYWVANYPRNGVMTRYYINRTFNGGYSCSTASWYDTDNSRCMDGGYSGSTALMHGICSYNCPEDSKGRTVHSIPSEIVLNEDGVPVDPDAWWSAETSAACYVRGGVGEDATGKYEETDDHCYYSE